MALPHTTQTAELTAITESSHRLREKKKYWEKNIPKLLNPEIPLPVKKNLSHKSAETRTTNVGKITMCMSPS